MKRTSETVYLLSMIEEAYEKAETKAEKVKLKVIQFSYQLKI